MTSETPLQNLGPDDAITPIMIYTSDHLSWGQFIHKKALLPGRALVGVSVPDFLSIYDANSMVVIGSQIAKPIKYTEIHVPVTSVLAYHLMPPHQDQIDYDESAPNRVMKPFTAHVGSFHFNASMRISDITTIKNTLEVAKSAFFTVYDVEVTHPTNPNMKPIKINMAYVRREMVLVGLT